MTKEVCRQIFSYNMLPLYFTRNGQNVWHIHLQISNRIIISTYEWYYSLSRRANNIVQEYIIFCKVGFHSGKYR